MPMKFKNLYKKQPFLIFAPYIFLIFLDTQLHEPKISETTISEYFSFFRRNFNYSVEFGTQMIGDGYHKFRSNGSEGCNEIFSVGILENLLAAKSEGNCIKFVVSHFLIVIGNIIANYQ